MELELDIRPSGLNQCVMQMRNTQCVMIIRVNHTMTGFGLESALDSLTAKQAHLMSSFSSLVSLCKILRSFLMQTYVLLFYKTPVQNVHIFPARSITMKTIQSPDGVALLMENMWLRHKAGIKQRPNNIYMVELPPTTEEELSECRRKAKVLVHILSSVPIFDTGIR